MPDQDEIRRLLEEELVIKGPHTAEERACVIEALCARLHDPAAPAHVPAAPPLVDAFRPPFAWSSAPPHRYSRPDSRPATTRREHRTATADRLT